MFFFQKWLKDFNVNGVSVLIYTVFKCVVNLSDRIQTEGLDGVGNKMTIYFV